MRLTLMDKFILVILFYLFIGNWAYSAIIILALTCVDYLNEIERLKTANKK